jgi:hypothetical protein
MDKRQRDMWQHYCKRQHKRLAALFTIEGWNALPGATLGDRWAVALRTLLAPPVEFGLVVVPEGGLEFGGFEFRLDGPVRMTERTLKALVRGEAVHLVSSVV